MRHQQLEGELAEATERMSPTAYYWEDEELDRSSNWEFSYDDLPFKTLPVRHGKIVVAITRSAIYGIPN